MNQTADERLVVMLEARIRDFEKNMAKAEQRGTRSYQTLRRGSQSATAQMEADMARSTSRINQALGTVSTRIGAFGKAFAGGLVGALAIGGLTEAVGRVNQLAEGVAGIGDAARRAGLSAKEFQEWSHVAQQNRIGIDTLTDGLKELQLRADEFAVTGKGPAAEAFGRLGYSAKDVARKMKDPSAMLLEIMGRVEQLDRAAQIRIFDELLGGTGGERFVELLDQGARKIAETKREASDLGLVMSDELIAKADLLNRQFNAVANTVGVVLKSAIISAAASLSDFIDGFRDFENQRDTTLQARQTAIMGQRADLVAEIAAIRAGGRPESWGGQVEAIEDTIAALTAEEDRIIAILSARTERTWAPKGDTWTPPETPAAPPGSRPGSRGRSGPDDLESAIAATERQIAANKAEAQSLDELAAAGKAYGGSLDYARKRAELLIAAQKAGIDLTPDQIAGLEELARTYAASGAAAADAALRMQDADRAAERGRDAVTGFLDEVILKGGSARKALASLLAEMAKVQMRNAIFGLSRSGGIFGTLFGEIGNSLTPSFDGGGHTGNASRSGGLDGKGGFLAMLHPRETVTDHTRGQTAPAARAQALAVTVTMDPSTARLGAFVRDQAGRVVAASAPMIVNQAVDATYRQAREVPIG